MVLDEEVAMLEQLTDLAARSAFCGAACCAALVAGRPRGSLGVPAARALRSLAMAERTALLRSRRTWNVQS